MLPSINASRIMTSSLHLNDNWQDPYQEQQAHATHTHTHYMHICLSAGSTGWS
jgi:hypothetical protein